MGRDGEIGVSRQVDEVQVERSIVHRRRGDILESHGRRDQIWITSDDQSDGLIGGGVNGDLIAVLVENGQGQRGGHIGVGVRARVA